MNRHIVKFALLCIIVIVLQVWLFNPMALFRVATPYVYPLLWLFLPIGLGRYTSLLLGFALGLVLDYLSLTPGLHTSVMTFLAFIRSPLLSLFVEAKIPQSALPLYDMLKGRSIAFFVTLMAIHHVLLYGLDTLGGFYSGHTLLRLGAGYLFSLFVSGTIATLATLRSYTDSLPYGK